ncbi:MAG: hypothetical protein RL274_909 [Pseudomonadota bacterium]|jgi:sugar lactone lactonase YvrE
MEITRRQLLATSGLAACGTLIPSLAFAANPVIPEATIAARQNAPVIAKKVNQLFNTKPTIDQPNDLQFAANGDLWILDQKNPNKVFTVNPKTGAVISSIETESLHGSGITYGNGAWFIASTKVATGNPSTLKVDPKTGKTLKKWETPGWGIYGSYLTRTRQPGDLPLESGGHGVKWAGNGQYWLATPAGGKLYLINAEEGTVARSIQAPTIRTHGIALEGDYIWCTGSDEAEIYKLRMSDGGIVAKIVLDKKADPSLHGLDIKDGVLWYCDAAEGWICSLT